MWPQLVGRNAVMVSEPFANKHNVHAGDTLILPLGAARIPFRVLDVYYDYSNERGFILMDRGTLLKYLPDAGPSNVAVYLKPGVSAEQGQSAVQTALAGRKVLVASNRALRQEGDSRISTGRLRSLMRSKRSRSSSRSWAWAARCWLW